MHSNVHSSTVDNSQDMEANKSLLIDERIKTCYIYTVEYYSPMKKNEITPFAAVRMDLEIIITSEVTQRKTTTI